MMATRFPYPQTFVLVRWTMALVVAPPPRNPDDGHQNYELDYDRLAAFFLEPGQAALIEKGTWHYAVPLGHECEFVNITLKNQGEGTSRLDAEMRLDKILLMRPISRCWIFAAATSAPSSSRFERTSSSRPRSGRARHYLP
jgi:hypothetical protein